MGERTTAKRSDGREQPTPKQAEVNRRRIAKAIRDNPEKSDRQIAKEMGVSDKTVGKVRLSMSAEDDSESSSAHEKEPESSQETEPIADNPAPDTSIGIPLTQEPEHDEETVADEQETKLESVPGDL